jgi:hypothetical protein
MSGRGSDVVCVTSDDDDNARSVRRIVPHELERVGEERSRETEEVS